MNLFPDAVADIPPCWRQPHHPLSVPDVLVPSTDPAVVAALQERAVAWSKLAETQRNQTVRLWTLEDRPTADGPLLYRAHRQTTPAAAWDWFTAMQHTPGHRVVLIDPATHRRLP